MLLKGRPRTRNARIRKSVDNLSACLEKLTVRTGIESNSDNYAKLFSRLANSELHISPNLMRRLAHSTDEDLLVGQINAYKQYEEIMKFKPPSYHMS